MILYICIVEQNFYLMNDNEIRVKFVLIKDNQGLSRMNVIIDCPDGGCVHEVIDCRDVLKQIKQCVKEEETEKRN